MSSDSEKAAAASYLADMAKELREIADRHGLKARHPRSRIPYFTQADGGFVARNGSRPGRSLLCARCVQLVMSRCRSAIRAESSCRVTHGNQPR